METTISKPSKYRNRKTRMGGRVFDSKLEANRWLVLKDKEKRGEISELRCQPAFELSASSPYSPYVEHVCTYKTDFQYFDKKKRQYVIEDVKGVTTALFSLKAKLFRANYPDIELRIIKAKDIAS